jgi:hypothetical protein
MVESVGRKIHLLWLATKRDRGSSAAVLLFPEKVARSWPAIDLRRSPPHLSFRTTTKIF